MENCRKCDKPLPPMTDSDRFAAKMFPGSEDYCSPACYFASGIIPTESLPRMSELASKIR